MGVLWVILLLATLTTAWEAAPAARLERVEWHGPNPAPLRIWVHPEHDFQGELKTIFLGGVERSKFVTRVTDLEQAEIIVFDVIRFAEGYDSRMRPVISKLYNDNPKRPIICVDWHDAPQIWPCCENASYFKRSVVSKDRDENFPATPEKYPRPVFHISYALKAGFGEAVTTELEKLAGARSIDVAVFFEPNDQATYYHRRGRAAIVVSRLQDLGWKVHVGVKGARDHQGRDTIQNSYVQTMADSKIIVCTNPDGWEGDYRLLEALSSGALILIDRMEYLPGGLVDGVNIVQYKLGKTLEDTADLREKLLYYLAHPDEAAKIGRAGRNEALRYHRPVVLVDSIFRAVVPDRWHPANSTPGDEMPVASPPPALVAPTSSPETRAEIELLKRELAAKERDRQLFARELVKARGDGKLGVSEANPEDRSEGGPNDFNPPLPHDAMVFGRYVAVFLLGAAAPSLFRRCRSIH